jgi:hypothetical protein
MVALVQAKESIMTRKEIWAWVANSETILWARIQVAFGAAFGIFLVVWSVLSSTDVSPLLKDPRWIAVWAIVNGVVTELLRRHGTFTTPDNHLLPLDPGNMGKAD